MRLKGYDYSRPGAFFVTICVQDRECVLGDVVGDRMELSDCGHVAHDLWEDIPVRFSTVTIRVFVVMPNHVHAVIVIHPDGYPVCRGAVSAPPRSGFRRRGVVSTPHDSVETTPSRGSTLGRVIAYYKYRTTKRINAIHGTPGARFWQRGYYDRIIRSEGEMAAICRYVIDNPRLWAVDDNNPSREGQDL